MRFYQGKEQGEKMTEGGFKIWRCFYCKVVLTRETYTKDHLIPKSRLAEFGVSEKDKKNKVPCCVPCNRAKGPLTPWEFKQTWYYRTFCTPQAKKRYGTYPPNLTGNDTD